MPSFASFVGRRKSATVNLMLIRGLGQIQINGVLAQDFFRRYPIGNVIAHQPFRFFSHLAFDVKANSKGGGVKAQAEALQLGLVRRVLFVQPRVRHLFRQQKLTTRDSRQKERRKYGMKKARKAPQFSKRLLSYVVCL